MSIKQRQKPFSFVQRPESDIPDVEDRTTDELIIGFVGPVGSGISLCATKFSNLLTKEFGYTGVVTKVSDVINRSSDFVSEQPVSQEAIDRTERLQKIGTKLREKFGNKYLIEKVISEINAARGTEKSAPKARRHFTLIDSIKHPDEIHRLREVYGDTFWLVGVFAPESVRKKRLLDRGYEDAYVLEIMQRDEDEGKKSGQRVRDAMFAADLFVRNDAENDLKLDKTIKRFLDVIFNLGVQTPSKDEVAMYAAASAAAGSACLSRQVGAVITDAKGEIIGTGNNDVPKFGGGAYNLEDQENDHRCYRWKSKICHNDNRKQIMLKKIAKALSQSPIAVGRDESKIAKVLETSDIKNLIEFSRAVHAEMEAIISVARVGKSSIVGANLYSTTFPCHNCARHIVAAGIRRVIYIEPYTKSLAVDLHDDAISIDEADEGSKVVFLQYEGVAPKNMLRLFKERGPRKSRGKLLLTDPREAKPASLAPLDGFEGREELIVAKLAKIESSHSKGAGNAER